MHHGDGEARRLLQNIVDLGKASFDKLKDFAVTTSEWSENGDVMPDQITTTTDYFLFEKNLADLSEDEAGSNKSRDLDEDNVRTRFADLSELSERNAGLSEKLWDFLACDVTLIVRRGKENVGISNGSFILV